MFWNNQTVVTEVGLSNAHARTVAALEEAAIEYSRVNSHGVYEHRLKNYRDAERDLVVMLRSPDASFGSHLSTCPGVVIEVASGQS